jgi:hypothetical protein
MLDFLRSVDSRGILGDGEHLSWRSKCRGKVKQDTLVAVNESRHVTRTSRVCVTLCQTRPQVDSKGVTVIKNDYDFSSSNSPFPFALGSCFLRIPCKKSSVVSLGARGSGCVDLRTILLNLAARLECGV